MSVSTNGDGHEGDAIRRAYTRAREALDAAREAILELEREHGLRFANRPVDHVISEIQSAEPAVNALRFGAPMADSFPNGNPRPKGPLTPKQISYLVDLASKQENENIRHLMERIESALGRTEGKACKATTKSGSPCTQVELRYGSEGLCSAHASEQDRERNRRLKAEEQEMLANNLFLYRQQGALPSFEEQSA